jgi:hypothetical protein
MFECCYFFCYAAELGVEVPHEIQSFITGATFSTLTNSKQQCTGQLSSSFKSCYLYGRLSYANMVRIVCPAALPLLLLLPLLSCSPF